MNSENKAVFPAQPFVPVLFAYIFFLISAVSLFYLTSYSEIGSQNYLFLSLLFLMFAVSHFISLWVMELRLVFLSLMIWFCIGFLEIGHSSLTVEANVSVMKWAVLFLVVILGIAVALARRKPNAYRRPFFEKLSLFFFLAYIFFVSGLSPISQVSFARAAGFLAMALLFHLLILACVSPDLAISRFYSALWWAANGVVVLSLLSLLGVLPSYEFLPNRFQGIFNNPNGLGPWLNLAVMMNTIFFTRRRSIARKLFCLLLGAAAIFLLFRCNSRANYVGLFVGLLVLLIYSRQKWLWILFIGLIGGFLVAYESYYREPLISFDWKEHLRLETRMGATTGRAEKWQISLERVRENPWYGAGLGAQEEMMERAEGPLTDYGRSRLLFDNSYLNFLYETGYPGFCLFAAWLLISLFYVWQNSRSQANTPFGVLSVYALSLALDLCAVSVFESFLGTAGNIVSLVLWASLGFTAVHPAPKENRPHAH